MEKFEKNILELFLYHDSLKFNEIEKSLKIRSNKLSYHIKKLIEKEILEKREDTYNLSEKSEYLIPYISNKITVLPVIIIHIGNNKQCFLYERLKRPFKNKLGLPGGRLLMNESIEECTKRIMKSKHNLDIKLKKINSISLEHVKNKQNKLHSFLLILVSAEAKNKIKLTNIEKNKSKIISSDYQLLKNNSSSEIKIKTIITKI